jgi:hypothetical protein
MSEGNLKFKSEDELGVFLSYLAAYTVDLRARHHNLLTAFEVLAKEVVGGETARRVVEIIENGKAFEESRAGFVRDFNARFVDYDVNLDELLRRELGSE